MVGWRRAATAALDERAQERLWGGGSSTSGSDGSASCSPELADLVDSFYGGDETWVEDWVVPSCAPKVEVSQREVLGRLVDGVGSGGAGGGLGSVGKRVREEVQKVLAAAAAAGGGGGGGSGLEEREEKGPKRMIMAFLRDGGFDAGLCKSRPDAKTTLFPSGARHEYVDVIADDGARFVVDLNLAAEFEIARPTPEYAALLAAFPPVFVGLPETLREIVCMMCEAAKESLRRRDMHVPPWRRTDYMLAKWFGSYKRTTNRVKKSTDVGSSAELGKGNVAAAAATVTVVG